MPDQRIYRPCVLAVFVDKQGRILLAERSDQTNAWQLPQGGINSKETPEEALYREMEEELGTREFDIVKRCDELIRYDWPDGVGLNTKKYLGQEQHWFVTQFHQGAKPDLEAAEDNEFVATKWGTVRDALDHVVDFKREAYLAGFRALGMI